MFDNPVVQAVLIAGGSLIVREILVYFVFKRMDEYTSLRADIAEALVFYADVYSNGPLCSEEAWKDAGSTLRRLAARLFAFSHRRNWMIGVWNVPSSEEMSEAAKCLIGLSNGRSKDAIQFVAGKRKKIEEGLRLSTDKS